MAAGILAILTGFILDLLWGDPPFLPHPVRLIGRAIAGGERGIRKIMPRTPRYELLGGGVLVLIVVGGTGALAWGIVSLAGRIHPAVQFAVESVMVYQVLAVKDLKEESMAVYRALKEKDIKKSGAQEAGIEENDLSRARALLSRIVGRDTARLDAGGITRAAVETVAENTGDGVIAPLFFMALGGPVLGLAYKAVNTLDSMIGYKNERFLYFGRAAARLDDLTNYLPARAAAWLMIGAARLLALDSQGAKRIYKRDKSNHSSPNSAHTEAACAGALGVRLGGDASYFGKPVHKPTIGDPTREIEAEDIVRANRLLYMTAGLGLAAALIVRAVLIGLWGRGGF